MTDRSRVLATNPEAAPVIHCLLAQGWPVDGLRKELGRIDRDLFGAIKHLGIDWSYYPAYEAGDIDELMGVERRSGFAEFDVDVKRWLVSEAPSEGLKAWLAERSIPPVEFYRWRKEFA